MIDDCGHGANLDRLEEFNAALLEFLRDLCGGLLPGHSSIARTVCAPHQLSGQELVLSAQ